ncbi:hypothetical protein [Pontibacter ruber]|uniref:PH domain-containing protein n=1 Tax=Pontibacter ruber TaxID=1343895 RepID=A0ABW5D3X0_9BACT|nr:hypothetical protein [Pontibacter ruber]
MYINLYPTKELQRTKQSLLGFGIFLAGGGVYALVREVLQREQLQLSWLLSACIIMAVGLVLVSLGAGWIQLKEAFFSMNPERISYRLTLYGQQRMVNWNAVESVRIIPNTVIFEFKSGKRLVLRLGLVQDEKVARHIEASIRLAALQQNISINGVQVHKQKAGYIA